MTEKVEAKELVDCVKEELGVDIVIGEADPSLTFQKLFGFTTKPLKLAKENRYDMGRYMVCSDAR